MRETEAQERQRRERDRGARKTEDKGRQWSERYMYTSEKESAVRETEGRERQNSKKDTDN